MLTYIHIGHGGVPQRTPLLPAATGPYGHQRHSELARPPRLPLAASPGQAAPTLQPRGLRVERVGWSLLGPRSSRAKSLQLVAQGVGLTRPTPAHSDILHPRALCSTSSTVQGVLAPPPQTNLPTEGPRRPLTGWLPPPCADTGLRGTPPRPLRSAAVTLLVWGPATPQGPASRVTRADVARVVPRKTTGLVIV